MLSLNSSRLIFNRRCQKDAEAKAAKQQAETLQKSHFHKNIIIITYKVIHYLY